MEKKILNFYGFGEHHLRILAKYLSTLDFVEMHILKSPISHSITVTYWTDKTVSGVRFSVDILNGYIKHSDLNKSNLRKIAYREVGHFLLVYRQPFIVFKAEIVEKLGA